MSKNTWIAVGAVIAMVVLGLVIYSLAKPKTLVTPSGNSVGPRPSPAVKMEVNSNSSYLDSSGFSFKYPDSITVSDDTPADGSYYALVTLKNPADKMMMTVKVKDVTYKTVEDWLAKDKEAPKNPTILGKTSLNGINGSQFAGSGKLITTAIDQGVLYLFESLKDDGFWEKTHQQVVSTFVFTNPAESKSPSGGQSVGSDAVYEAEEIVE